MFSESMIYDLQGVITVNTQEQTMMYNIIITYAQTMPSSRTKRVFMLISEKRAVTKVRLMPVDNISLSS